MTNHSFHIPLFFFVAFLATACVDEINLPVPPANLEKLVIQGKLTLGAPSRVEISISRTANYTAGATPETIDGASVTLACEDGEQFSLAAAGKGRYTLDLSSGIMIGRAYQLLVRLADGQRYESTWEALLPVPAPDSLSYDVVIKQEQNSSGNIVEEQYVQFFVTTPLRAPGAEDKSYLLWNFEDVFMLPQTPPSGPGNWIRCYVLQKLNLDEITVFDGKEAGGDQLSRHLLFEERIDHRFALGFYLTAYQQSLSPGAYAYWNQVNAVVRRTGGLFEAPPGPIKSNLHNVDNPEEEVLGFFYAVATDTIRRRIEIPFALRPPYLCEPGGSPPTDAFCMNCLLWPNSSLDKPDYWE